MSDVGDAPRPEYAQEQAFPTSVTIAGIAWVAFGALILLNLLMALLLLGGLAAVGPNDERGTAMAGGACGGLILALFAAVFLQVGVQSIRGTARDTLGNGIGSIIFGLLNLGSGMLQAVGGNIIQAGIGFLIGAGLIVAGVLALVGRSDYKAWRQAHKRLVGEANR